MSIPISWYFKIKYSFPRNSFFLCCHFKCVLVWWRQQGAFRKECANSQFGARGLLKVLQTNWIEPATCFHMWPATCFQVSNIDHQPNMPLNATWDPRQTPDKINEPVKDLHPRSLTPGTVNNIETTAEHASRPTAQIRQPCPWARGRPRHSREVSPGWPLRPEWLWKHTRMSTEGSSLAVFGQLSHYPTHWVQGVAQADLQAANQMNYKGKIPNDIKSLTRQHSY